VATDDPPEPPGTAAMAFSATQAIRAGLWDRHLRIIAGAIKLRQRQIDEGTDHA